MFFLLPVGVDYRARRYPVVTFTIMGICTLIYLVTLSLQAAYGRSVPRWVFTYLWLSPAHSHWWAYLTSMFVHEGFLHLAGNMLYLFLFGSCVEDVIGRPRFVGFYLFCGLVAELSHIAISSQHFASEIPLGGASGAISGCIGGFLLLFLRTQIEFKWFVLLFLRFWNGEFFLPAWLVISFWFLSDLAGMVLSIGAEQESGVAFGAHVGGTLCGLAIIALEKAFRKLPIDDEPEEVPLVAVPLPATPAPRREPMRIQLKPKVAQTPTEFIPVYLYMDQNQSGPYDSAQIQELFREGIIPGDALYWREGMQDWRNVEELKQTTSNYGL